MLPDTKPLTTNMMEFRNGMRASAVPLYLGFKPVQAICSNLALSNISGVLDGMEDVAVVAPLSCKALFARLAKTNNSSLLRLLKHATLVKGGSVGDRKKESIPSGCRGRSAT